MLDANNENLFSSVFYIKRFTVVCFCFIGSIECHFSEPTRVRQCSGEVGQLLIFHLPNTANSGIRLIKDNKYFFLKIANNQIISDSPLKEYVNQSKLFTNGTIKLGKAMKRHSGDYLLEEHDFNGHLLKKVNVHLEIQGR